MLYITARTNLSPYIYHYFVSLFPPPCISPSLCMCPPSTASMCCCLVCVTICKKRSRARSKKRQRQIQDTTRDVSIANRGAMERGESPEPLYETGQMQQHTAAVNALQTAPSEAVIFSNPNLDTDLPPQYKQLQHLSSHTSFAAAPPTHSTSWLAVHEQLGSRQIDPQPSAPTPDNFVVSIVESLTS